VELPIDRWTHGPKQRDKKTDEQLERYVMSYRVAKAQAKNRLKALHAVILT